MNKYYTLLGLTKNSSKEDIKKSFRKLAKKYHPDVSKEENAEDKFIAINEAYEYVLAVKEGRISAGKINRQPTQTSQNGQSTNQNSSKGQKKHRDPAYRWNSEEAREKARKKARMKYEEYLKTDEYKWSNSLFVVFKTAAVFIPVVIILTVAIIGGVVNGAVGFILGLLLASPLLFATYLAYDKVKDDEVLIAFKQLFSFGRTYKYVIGILSLIFLITCTLSSFFSVAYVVLAYFSVLGLNFGLKKLVNISALTPRFIVLGISPFIVNLFFAVNFIYLSDAQVEVYRFKYKGESGIVLENDTYDNQPWIRYFFDNKSMDGNRVKYYTAQGFLGVKVLQDFDFYWDYRR